MATTSSSQVPATNRSIADSLPFSDDSHGLSSIHDLTLAFQLLEVHKKKKGEPRRNKFRKIIEKITTCRQSTQPSKHPKEAACTVSAFKPTYEERLKALQQENRKLVERLAVTEDRWVAAKAEILQYRQQRRLLDARAFAFSQVRGDASRQRLGRVNHKASNGRGREHVESRAYAAPPMRRTASNESNHQQHAQPRQEQQLKKLKISVDTNDDKGNDEKKAAIHTFGTQSIYAARKAVTCNASFQVSPPVLHQEVTTARTAASRSVLHNKSDSLSQMIIDGCGPEDEEARLVWHLLRMRMAVEKFVGPLALENNLPWHENLADRIDALREAGSIPRSLAKNMHDLRIWGNRAAHQQDGEPLPRKQDVENAVREYFDGIKRYDKGKKRLMEAKESEGCTSNRFKKPRTGL